MHNSHSHKKTINTLFFFLLPFFSRSFVPWSVIMEVLEFHWIDILCFYARFVCFYSVAFAFFLFMYSFFLSTWLTHVLYIVQMACARLHSIMELNVNGRSHLFLLYSLTTVITYDKKYKYMYIKSNHILFNLVFWMINMIKSICFFFVRNVCGIHEKFAKPNTIRCFCVWIIKHCYRMIIIYSASLMHVLFKADIAAGDATHWLTVDGGFWTAARRR